MVDNIQDGFSEEYVEYKKRSITQISTRNLYTTWKHNPIRNILKI